MSTVVIERLEKLDYLTGCASLPADYGSASWEERPEVQAIRKAVFASLDRLDAETGISSRFAARKVLVKPNLVMVYDHLGTERPISPETTDPRVLDALVLWLSSRAGSIDIVESSGRGSPTRAAFATSGIDRLAKKRGCGLIALEEEAVDRYFLPKARLQREILIPKPFSAVVRGEAAYVSVPKLKTNLYTGVTLGFKNAMGVIPYNLRQRHHHYGIDRKLVEMLYLFKPDMVLLDGVVGGEGECPAPVDPVDSRMIVAGDHAVETDRVVTRLMGFDPTTIELMRVADELGFGESDDARVFGDQTPVHFRPADTSLLSERVRAAFPGLKILIGIDRAVDAARNRAGSGVGGEAGPAFARELEKSCWGGCAATTRFGLALVESEGYRPAGAGVLVVGPGIVREGAAGGRVWFDAEGRAYDETALLSLPGKKAVIGSCGKPFAGKVDFFVEGCMPFANAPHMIIHQLTGTSCKVLSTKNRHLGAILSGMSAQRSARRRHLKSGERLDVPFETEAEPKLHNLPERGDGASPDWVPWPLPAIGKKELGRLLAFEDDAAVASLRGVFVPRILARVFWTSQAWTTALVTAAPLVLSALSALGLGLGLSAGSWLFVWLAIEALHAAELPFSLRAMRAFAQRGGRPRPTWQTILLTLAMGYPSWVPWAIGIHEGEGTEV